MSRKREVRDARFKNREPKSTPPREPTEHAPTRSDAPRGPAKTPRSARPSSPVEPSREPATPSAPTPWWMSANAIIPAVLVVFLGWAFYEKFGPFGGAAATSADAGADAGAATEADTSADAAAPAANSADAGPAAEPTPTPPAVADDSGPALDPNPVEPAHREATTPDPRHGAFTIAQATEGLTGTGALHADIVTSMGSFDCELLADAAPNTVANFVGLARGTRDFWDPVAGAWARRPFYDGSIFHRVIPDFMIQGGDILRSGTGDTGYEIRDENVQGHNAAGQLCMANHGPNTGSGQFFITETAKPHLDGTYSIFGRCTPTDLVRRITAVPRDDNDRPRQAVFIRRITIRRGAAAP